jgi:hypothetical protein
MPRSSTARSSVRRSSASARVLTDPDEIRRWAEERNARPARVKGTGGNGDIGIIRLDFPGYSGEDTLEEISWDDWFREFDQKNLALLVQDKTASGRKSNFNKLVNRETLEEYQRGRRSSSRKSRSRAVGAARARGTGTSRGRSRRARAAGSRQTRTTRRSATARRRGSQSGRSRTTKRPKARVVTIRSSRAKRGSTGRTAKKAGRVQAISSQRRSTTGRSSGSRRRAA